MALSQGKPTVAGTARGLLNVGVVAAVACLQGGLGLIKAGYARPARVGQGGNDFAKVNDVADARIAGVMLESITGGSADGDELINIQSGDWLMKNSAGVDAITVADIGKYCFVIDDETVAKTSASGTRPRAGVVKVVDSAGVMIGASPEIAAAASRLVFLPFSINATDLSAGTSAELVSPVAGIVSRVSTVVQTAIVTGGDVTATVGVTVVNGLTCTIADGAAKGSVVTDTPTAGHATAVVAAGDRIQIVPAAAFNAGGALNGILEIAY